MRTARWIAPLALVAGCLLLSAVAEGQHTGGCNCGRNQNLHAPWQLEGLTAAGQQSVGSGFDRWHRYIDPFSWAAGDNSVGPTNGANEIFFADTSFALTYYGIQLNPYVYGVTYSRPPSAFGTPSFNACPVPGGTSCGTFLETDVLLNLDFLNGWTMNPPNFANSGPAFVPATVIHELGHALGQHHNFDNLATMNYIKDIGGQYVFGADAAAARSNYSTRVVSVADMGTFPFRFVNGSGPDYNQPTTVTFSPTTVAAGSTFQIRDITVENPGSQSLSNVWLSFYLSSDRTITTSDVLLGYLYFTGQFTSGGWWEASPASPVTVTVPSTMPAGNYYVGAIATYNAGAQDSVTYNNSWATEQRITVTPAAPAACVPSSTKLCLNQGRFGVSITWRNYSNQTGVGTTVAIPGSTDSGLFWFFNSSNIEFLVKVLNGCGINSRYWVLAAATTDVQYTMTVVDHNNGTTKTYTNPLGTASPAIIDTAAFATCP